MRETKHFLTVCHLGKIRSVTLANLLKNILMQADILSCGVNNTSYDTMFMLCQWADVIFVTDSRITEKIPRPYRSKVVDFNVGSDKWQVVNHPELTARFLVYIKDYFKLK